MQLCGLLSVALQLRTFSDCSARGERLRAEGGLLFSAVLSVLARAVVASALRACFVRFLVLCLCFCSFFGLAGRYVLRNEVLFYAWLAVIIGPAVDSR